MVKTIETKIQIEEQSPMHSIQVVSDREKAQRYGDNASARRTGTEMNVLEFGKALEGPKSKLLQNMSF